MTLHHSVIFYLLISCCFSNAYKILAVFPFPVQSMNSLGHGLVRHLLNAGHEVTYMTVFPMTNPPKKNLRQIDISMNKESFKECDILRIKYNMDITRNHLSIQRYMITQELGIAVAEATFSNPNVEKILKNPEEEFHLVIADLLESEIYAALSTLYDCPMIWSYSMSVHWMALRLIDESTNPTYTIDYYSDNFPSHSITQRIQELMARAMWTLLHWFYIVPREKNIYEKVFTPLIEARGKIVPRYEDLIYNSSFMFSNDYINPTTPNIPQNCKLVGGYHIQNPPEPLPMELENLFRNSKHGIIYFSMGSNWQSKDFPQDIIKQLLLFFGELKQTVLWKYEEDLQNVPDNVHVVKWAPQQSVLAHPKCVVFITHGGQLSITEAKHFGVPVVGIPVNYDQLTNIDIAVQLEYAIKVNLDYDLPKNLRNAITDILQNQKYKRRAKEVSAIFHDRPVPPGRELVHWVEHVIKTEGALHLRSPALMIPWYKKIYLDLVIIICGSLIFASFVLNAMNKNIKQINLSKITWKKIN